MIVTIKPHSAFKSFFTDTSLKADLVTYHDVLFYLNALQARFMYYLKQQNELGINESFVLLDKNLREINADELRIRKAKEGDVIHIVPAIVGGGGKRGILAILAVAAMVIAWPVAAAAMSAGAGTGAAALAGIGSIPGAIAAMGPVMSNIVVNIGLALLSALFAPSAKKAESTRENDAFGSLVNSTNSGTPVALHYGLVRVAGQLISGYVSTVNHGRNQEVDVYGETIEVNK